MKKKSYVVNLANDAHWRRALNATLARLRVRADRLAALERGELVAKVVSVRRHWVEGHYRDPHERLIAVRKPQPVVRSPKLRVLTGGKR